MSSLIDQPFTCPFCNLYCQDRQIPNPGSSKHEWKPECPLAKAAFDKLPSDNPQPALSGTPLSLEEALDLACRSVQHAQMPLVVLSGEASREAQSAGIKLSRQLYAFVDTPWSRFGQAIPLASINPGTVTCTLGEIAQNADDFLFWGCRPEKSHPRLIECITFPFDHMSFEVLYGDEPINSPNLRLKAGETIPFIEKLRLLACDDSLNDQFLDLKKLRDYLTDAHFGVLFYGDELLAEGPYALAELFRLLDDVKGKGRWHAVYLSPGGNSLGAAEALSRETGFTHTVRFAGADAEFMPQEGDAENILSREATDLVIFVGQPFGFSKDSMKRLEKISSITLSSTAPAYKTLWLPVGQTGIHTDGTMVRFDGVILSLSAALSNDLPHMEELLRRLAEGVTA